MDSWYSSFMYQINKHYYISQFTDTYIKAMSEWVSISGFTTTSPSQPVATKYSSRNHGTHLSKVKSRGESASGLHYIP